MQSFCAVLVLSVLISGTGNAGKREAEAKQMGLGDYSLTLKVGELERRYLVHVPPQYDGTTPMPVVVMPGWPPENPPPVAGSKSPSDRA
jgi:poly(3-hydroxybutyrate) depolymerase